MDRRDDRELREAEYREPDEKDHCYYCDGTGKMPHPAVSVREGGMVDCWDCDGKGYIISVVEDVKDWIYDG